MSPTILVPLDGSVLAEQSLPVAKRLARAENARLLIVRVVGAAPHEPDPATRDVWAQDYLAGDYLNHIARRIRTEAGTEAETSLLKGDPGAGILDAVRRQRPSMVVMTTHGRSGLGRWLFGSTTDKVLRHSDAPVVVVPPAIRSRKPGETFHAPRILIALDGSARSESLLETVRRLAEELRAEIALVRLVDDTPMSTVRTVGGAQVLHRGVDQDVERARQYLDGIAQRLRTTIPNVSVRCEPGDPARRVAQIAEEEEADLIALVTRGRGGMARFFLGSVAASTVRHARVPVLIARSGAAESALADTSPNEREGGVSTPTAAPEGVWLELSPSDVELIVEGLNALRLTGRTSAAETDAIYDLQGRLHSSLPEGLVVDASD
jgi:nucleotide-binding universal stress UspA family protein